MGGGGGGGGRPYEKRKALGTRLIAWGLCVNKMADASLSSEDEEIENPIQTAFSKEASLVEPEKASISLVCCN